MQTIFELGEAVASRRKALRLRQADVAAMAGIAPEMLSRFERGRLAELGARKLLNILGALGMELSYLEIIPAGSLDDLKRERSGRR